MKKIFFLSIIIISLILQVSCSFFTSEEKKVEKSYNEFLSAVSNRNYSEVWNLIAYGTQKQYEDFIYKPFIDHLKKIPKNKKQIKFPNTNMTIEDMEKMTAKDFFIFQFEHTELRDELLKSLIPERKIEKITIDGDTAILQMEKSKDETISNKITMKLEDSRWRIVLMPPGDVKF